MTRHSYSDPQRHMPRGGAGVSVIGRAISAAGGSAMPGSGRQRA
jgi:hypothetical protein